jgi:flagellar biosynthesis GTPase FlhF
MYSLRIFKAIKVETRPYSVFSSSSIQLSGKNDDTYMDFAMPSYGDSVGSSSSAKKDPPSFANPFSDFDFSVPKTDDSSSTPEPAPAPAPIPAPSPAPKVDTSAEDKAAAEAAKKAAQKEKEDAKLAAKKEKEAKAAAAKAEKEAAAQKKAAEEADVAAKKAEKEKRRQEEREKQRLAVERANEEKKKAVPVSFFHSIKMSSFSGMKHRKVYLKQEVVPIILTFDVLQ